MGFRDLHLFNVALVGKIAWKLIHTPESLVCKVLKARYFPNASFLDASLGSNPSLPWRGIIEAQGLLRRGLRWKVGSGDNISIWGQPWLNDGGSFYIQTPRFQGAEMLRVKDLLVPETRTWNYGLIVDLFSNRDVKAIMRTPVSPCGYEDRLIWHHTRDGVYSVKSGYKLADDITRVDEYTCDGDWNLIWRMKVPPKVKNFVWRVCRSILPTRGNIASKGVQTEGGCIHCSGGPETEWHILFNCTYALDCWRTAGLDERIEAVITRIESTAELIFQLLKELSETDGANFMTTMWQIWEDRNKLLWEGVRKAPSRSVTEAACFVNEWRLLKFKGQPTAAAKCEAWHRPRENSFKVNTDAAFFDETNEMGISMVLRDDRGDFLAARTLTFPGRFEVDIGEGMGVLEALSWIKQLGLVDVTVEGDSKTVMDAIRNNSNQISSFGDIIGSCRVLMNSIPNCNVSFVKRNANAMAHAFAKVSRSFPSPSLWTEPPDFVVGLPSIACTCGN